MQTSQKSSDQKRVAPIERDPIDYWKNDRGILYYFDQGTSGFRVVLWVENPPEAMEVRDIAATRMQDGQMILVAIGSDAKLLFRVGSPTPYFQNGHSHYFRWPDPRTPHMEANSITDVRLGSDGRVVVRVIGTDGRDLMTTQHSPNAESFGDWVYV